MSLLEAAKLIDVLRRYLVKYAAEELQYRPSDDSYDCPWCTAKHLPEGEGGLLIDTDGEHWGTVCCGETGDIYDLASAIEGISWPDAVEWIAHRYTMPKK